MSAIYFSFTTRTTQRHDLRIASSFAMNIVRLMVFFVLGLLLGTLLPSLVTWLLG